MDHLWISGLGDHKGFMQRVQPWNLQLVVKITMYISVDIHVIIFHLK